MSLDDGAVPVVGPTPGEILEAFRNFDYRLPEAELNAAQSMPDIMTPLLLDILAKAKLEKGGALPEEDDWAVFYALFLLAAFRNAEALEIVRKHSEKDPRWLDSALGDAVTECGARLFASMAFSNPSALHYFIENRDIDEFVRAAALEGLGALAVRGVLSGEAFAGYYRRLAADVLRRGKGSADSWLWFTFASNVALLDMREFHPLAEKAYAERWIEPGISTWEGDKSLYADPVKRRATLEKFAALVGNVAGELRGWHCFSEAYREECRREREMRENGRAEAAAQMPPSVAGGVDFFSPRDTIVNTAPKTRPNQPCPCGSGKKYKKCCGR